MPKANQKKYDLVTFLIKGWTPINIPLIPRVTKDKINPQTLIAITTY
jgi:hypothetical protein